MIRLYSTCTSKRTISIMGKLFSENSLKEKMRLFQSDKSENPNQCNFSKCGNNVVIEEGVRIFHPENIILEGNIYIGHDTILKGYYKNKMMICSGTWIGQQCFFHSAGGLTIESNVGIGPSVKIITSHHAEEGIDKPILHSLIKFGCVKIEEDCDIGIGSIILPGVTIGRGTQVGAGSVVTKSIDPYSVVAGVPARLIRSRKFK